MYYLLTRALSVNPEGLIELSGTTFERVEIPDLVLIRTRRFGDSRGWFSETYSARSFSEVIGNVIFVQDNQAFSASKGTLRGLHFQNPPKPQAKLIRVLRGSIFDVAVDLRLGSPTYGRWVGKTLTADGGEQLFVPRGFAHGYCTLVPNTEVAYKVDGLSCPTRSFSLTRTRSCRVFRASCRRFIIRPSQRQPNRSHSVDRDPSMPQAVPQNASSSQAVPASSALPSSAI
jgi:dTDP-4-dehydrorhamnose 3,5-epimerase